MTKFLIGAVLMLISAQAFAYTVGEKVGDVSFLYSEKLEAPYGNSWFVSFADLDTNKQAIITGTGKTAGFIGIYEFSCQADSDGLFVRKWNYAMNFGSVDSSVVPQQAIDNAIELGCK